MTIQWSKRAIKDVGRLPGEARRRIVAKVEQYAADPASLAHQVKALAGSDSLRLRVGDYRVIFAIEGGALSVMLVLRVRHRREAYD